MQRRVRHEFKKRESETNDNLSVDLKAGNPNKDICRKIMQGMITMTSGQVPAHHAFYGFNLKYGLTFKLGKEVTNWTEPIS